MSLRARLSLLVVGSVAAGLLLVALTTSAFLSRRVYQETDRALADRADAVAAGTAQIPFRDIVALPRIDNLVDATTFVQIVDLDGSVLARTSNLPDEIRLPVDEQTLAVARHERESARTVIANGAAIRLVEAPLTAALPSNREPGRSEPLGVIQVARTVGEVESGLRRARTFLFLGSGGALVVAGGLALLLTRAALRPLASMRTSAEEVAATGDPSRRLRPAGGRDDEVARLAAAFDRMLVRLEASGSALGAALDSQRRFVADASHELRTPLTSARGNLEIVLRNPEMDPDERAQAIGDAVAELERMSRLVDGLLTLARADAGRPPEVEPVSLSEVVHRSHRSALARGGARTFEMSDHLGGAEVAGSPELLRRLFDNLYDNALKYTGPTGSIVTRADVGDGWATVSITDDGPGIAADELPRIFERFYRSPGTRSLEGSGLGLAIVQWAAVLHGGTVSVVSAPGRGSTFAVTLPVLGQPTGNSPPVTEGW